MELKRLDVCDAAELFDDPNVVFYLVKEDSDTGQYELRAYDRVNNLACTIIRRYVVHNKTEVREHFRNGYRVRHHWRTRPEILHNYIALDWNMMPYKLNYLCPETIDREEARSIFKMASVD